MPSFLIDLAPRTPQKFIDPASLLAAGGAVATCTPVCTLSLDTVLDLARSTAGEEIDADAPLMEAGIDSLGAVELRNQLQRVAGECAALSSTLIFDHPTARQVTQYILECARPCLPPSPEEEGYGASQRKRNTRVSDRSKAVIAIDDSFFVFK